ncbi:zinc ribbon domain-containing protein [Butyribacter intestini]|uniref:zinc ribbon domain-containing protein n=1 Tax=Butyribacter intestini TaxID=1703332 RepID=UPI003AF0382D
MRCLKCGYENEKSARFCVNCGSRLGIESAKKIQAGNYNNIMNNQNRQQGQPPYQQQQFPQQGQSGNLNGNMQMNNGQKQPYQQPPYQNPNGNMQINNGQYPKQGRQINPNGNMQMSNGQKQPYQQQPYQQQQINPNGNMQINNGQYPQQGQQINPNGNMYINNGQYPQQINPNVNMYMNNGQQELPMKWHNFLVYAGFLLSILINLGNAARTIIEMFDEGGEQYIFYGFYPSAKIIDIVFVILNVILSVFLVYIWREMLQKKKNAWKKYLVSIIVVAALNCLAKILAMIIVGTDFGGDIITQYTIDIGMCVIFCSAMVSANNVYYKKRDHLFVN